MDDLYDDTTETEREVLTWSIFGEASRALAIQVADSGFRPDIVLAIARGGLTVAGALGYSLSVKNCFIRGSVVRYVMLPADSVDVDILHDATRREARGAT